MVTLGNTLMIARGTRSKMKTLSHFSSTPFIFNPSTIYGPIHRHDYKPRGFWLSDETDYGWAKWCKDQNWGVPGLQFETLFECDISNWLYLDSMEKLLKFTHEYKVIDTDLSILGLIEWRRVQSHFSGILITPYQRSCRLHMETHWYYGWDCASACVWDLSTIRIKE